MVVSGHAFNKEERVRIRRELGLDLINPNYTDITEYPYTVRQGLSIVKGRTVKLDV